MIRRQVDLDQRAYSAFTVKAVSKSDRRFTGVATTPAMDRVGDIVDPMGVKFTNPLVLLHQHRSLEPIGKVWFDKPTVKGITFEAGIPLIEEPPTLKERVEVAWGEIVHELVRFVSIGFRALKYAYTDDGGVEFLETEIYELSLVSIPALPDAVITDIKSMSTLDARVVKMLRRADTRGIPLISAREGHLKSGAVELIRR